MTGQWLYRKYRLKHYLWRGHVFRYFKISKYFKNNSITKIQLAPGELPVKQSGWLTADIWTGDVYFNAKRKLPFKSNSVDYIFSEHFLEHLDYETAVKHLGELYRVLKPDGVIRISVPDLESICKAYTSKDIHTLDGFLVLQRQIVPENVKPLFMKRSRILPAEFVNVNFSGFDHKYMWDFEVLNETLKPLGLINIKRYEEKKSDNASLKYLERHGEQDKLNRQLTFCIEATKPLYPIKDTFEYGDTIEYILKR